MPDIQSEMLRAAGCFMDGRYTDALKIYKKLAKEGSSRAMFNVAYCTQYGYGTEANGKEAFELYTRLLHTEEGDAAYNAAAMLLTGRGVPVDLERGITYMKQAVR